MRRSCSLLLLLSFVTTVHADNMHGSISIIANDFRTGLPVKGGMVWLGNSVKCFTVNENGKRSAEYRNLSCKPSLFNRK